MSITSTELASLKQIYQKHYGVELTDEEAINIGTRLLNLLAVIGKKLPSYANSDKKRYNNIINL